MKLRLKIVNKISVVFGTLVVFVLAYILVSGRMLKGNSEIGDEILEIYQPSNTAVIKLHSQIAESKIYIKEWFYNDQNTSKYKEQLSQFHETGYKKLNKRLDSLSQSWDKPLKAKLNLVFLSIDTLLFEHRLIMNRLSTKEDYSFSNKFIVKPKVVEGGLIFDITDRILANLKGVSKDLGTKIAQKKLEIQQSVNYFKSLIAWIAVILFFIISIAGFLFSNTLVRPINHLKKVLATMSKGELPDKLINPRSDEIGEMGKALNELIRGLKKISKFSKEIGKGDYESAFEPLGNNDELGNSLLLMRTNLKNASADAELRRIENDQRSWTSQGLAEFGLMLRESKESLEELTNQILTRLVRYLDASVGGLFIINDDDKQDVFLELIAFYAYDRRKYEEKKIAIGESLVGQCVLENETIFMSEIPEDYVHVTSGMGSDNPRSLVIVPLKLNEEVYGVVELASFKIFEPHQIEFVEKIGESIASTISTAKISIHTSKLLHESNEKSERLTKQEQESQKQIEQMEKVIAELRSREEKEKEQNKTIINQFKNDLTNLRKTNEEQHDEIEGIKMDYKNVSQAVDNSLGTYALSINGEYIEANDRYLKMLGVSFNELKGRKLDDFMTEEDAKSLDIQNFIPNLLSGHIYRQTNRYVINNESKWLYETFTPLYDEEGKFTKIFCLVSNFTEVMIDKNELEETIEKLTANIKKLKQRMV